MLGNGLWPLCSDLELCYAAALSPHLPITSPSSNDMAAHVHVSPAIAEPPTSHDPCRGFHKALCDCSFPPGTTGRD